MNKHQIETLKMIDIWVLHDVKERLKINKIILIYIQILLEKILIMFAKVL